MLRLTGPLVRTQRARSRIDFRRTWIAGASRWLSEALRPRVLASAFQRFVRQFQAASAWRQAADAFAR
jgi:hypothetical protein